jgi:IS5 family transposase
MRPAKRQDSGQQDLLRSRLDRIVDPAHALVKMARAIDWRSLETKLDTVYRDGPGQPPLPTRFMAGLAILKHMHNLSNEVLCDRWLENPYYQLFCGEEFFRHRLPFDRSSITRWRQRMGEERLNVLLQESLHLATRSGAAKPQDFTRVIVDTTVQPKAIAFPTDAKLLHRARERLVRLAQRHGVKLRQSYVRIGKAALIRHQRYAHARQFKRANRDLKSLRTYLGRVIRDIGRKTGKTDGLREIFAQPLALARQVREQRPRQRGHKVYSLHAPEVECIARARRTGPMSSA